MEWLNYHHLLYFWVVAREGSIARACELLELAQPTISHQIHELEESLGQKLFDRIGRNIQVTAHGRLVFQYANEIFGLGRELLDAVKGLPRNNAQQLQVGVTGMLPKVLVFRLLEVALQLPEPIRIVCHEDRCERLMADLALHQLDLVLSDAPARPIVRIRAFNHLLGDSGLSFFAATPQAAQYRRGFPRSLHGAPLLLPANDCVLRRPLDRWFEGQEIHPEVRGEFSDCSTLKCFGQAGAGIFVLPSVVEADVQQRYNVQAIGHVDTIRSRCYAITVEKKLKHPAWKAITETAREKVFNNRKRG